LEYATPSEIKKRTEEILYYGSDRLILTSSTGPISKINQRIADNYQTFIDTVLKHYS